MNRDELPGIETRESKGSRSKLHYMTAASERIPNEGEKEFVGFVESTWKQTPGGKWEKSRPAGQGVLAQIAEVTTPLMSVKKMCAANHRVVFDDEGSYIENKTSGDSMEITEQKGEYMVDMWVRDEDCSGFRRQD
jgi:hypothetical protein